MDSRLHDRSLTAHPGTCEWIFHHDTFQTWLKSDNATLWIRGNPGTGKSTLLKNINNHLEHGMELAGVKGPCSVDLRLNFLFHGRGNRLQKTSTGFYRSLLFQLLKLAPNLSSGIVKEFVDNRKMKGQHGSDWTWSDDELCKLMRRSLIDASKRLPVWIIIDALDEGDEDAAIQLVDEFDLWLSDLEPSASSGSLHICFSSRRFPVIAVNVKLQVLVEKENHGDIAKYTASKLEQYRVRDEQAEEMFTQKARGIFLWVVLVFQKIRKLYQRGHFNLYNEIERAPEGLGDLFRSLLLQLDDEAKSSSLRLLRWVLCAREALSLDILRFALLTDPCCTLSSFKDYPKVREYTEEDDQLERRITYLSCGPVEVGAYQTQHSDSEDAFESEGALYSEVYLDSEDAVQRSSGYSESALKSEASVRFIHQSVKDFLLDQGGLILLDAHHESEETALSTAKEYLSRSCLKFIALQIDLNRFPSRYKVYKEYQNTIFARRVWLFLKYALKHWFIHEKLAGLCTHLDLVEYLHYSPNYIMDLTAKFSSLGYAPEKSFWRKRPSVLHLVSYYGWIRLLQAILECLDQVNSNAHSKKGHGQRTLSFQGLLNTVPFVNELVAYADISINSKDNDGRTPLYCAAEMGHTVIVETLLGRSDVDATLDNWSGTSPLIIAVKNGHKEVVKLLLQSEKIDVAREDIWGRSGL